MIMQKQILLAAVAIATTASFATAQLGRDTLFIDLETPTGGNITHLGCAYGLNNGFIYSSARSTGGAAGAAPHSVYQWDTAGNLVASVGQTAASDATVWGYRDGASSILGQVFFGWDGGIDVYDADATTGALTPAISLLGLGGPTVLAPLTVGAPGTITSVAVAGTHRALAFDDWGNGGFGSFFVGNFGGDIFEIDAAGTVLHQYPNTSSSVWSSYGFALDDKGDSNPVNDTLWINSSPASGKLVEYSIDRVLNVMTPTGLEIDRNQPGTAQGGLALVPGGLDGRNCGFDLIGVDQGTPDALSGYRVVQWDGYDPADEPVLMVGVDGGAMTRDVVAVNSATTTMDFDVVSAGTAGLPYLMFVDFAGAAGRPAGPIPGVGDVAWELSHPRIGSILVGAYAAGTRTQIPNFLTATTVGTQIEWQAFAIDVTAPTTACGKTLSFLGLPWSTTTVGSHQRGIDPVDIATIRTSGPNSFNSVTTSGYFSITADANTAADPIVAVTFDWAASSNPGQGSMVFDCDQTGMANTFWEGNGDPLCMGTYRNGSDVTVGLDYANPANNLIGTTICPTSIAHCVATNATVVNSYQTLKWNFVAGSFLPGTTLEFDIDTDGGLGNAGDQNVGMVVTVETVSGAIYTGELGLDPTTAQSCILKL